LVDVPCTLPPSKQRHYHITSLAVSKGVKGFGKNYGSSAPLFEVPSISQAEATLGNNTEREKRLRTFMATFGFDLQDIIEDDMIRSVWNAIYLITSVQKFSKTKPYLAISGDRKGIRLIESKIMEQQLDVPQLNYLESYYTLPKTKENQKNRLKEIKAML
jgi:hypothetical protein